MILIFEFQQPCEYFVYFPGSVWFLYCLSSELQVCRKKKNTSVFTQLLLEHLEAISPDQNDLLHELLQDLGDVPDVENLLGIVTNSDFI